jgi:hypothetical protein
MKPPALIQIRCDETGKVSLDDLGGYETRHVSTLKLLEMATADTKFPGPFSIRIDTRDYPQEPASADERILAYSKSAEQTRVIAIPDHVFWAWPQVGIADYEQLIAQMQIAGAKPPIDDRLFWIGNPETHPTRAEFLKLREREPRISAGAMSWVPNSHDPQTGQLAAKDNRYVSLPDHCQFRYLIDLQGRGYSGRLKLLLFSGRPLFVQARRWNEYFSDDLKPFEHFIPVREDLADLQTQLDWADSHPAEAAAIAARGLAYAQSHLRRAHAVVYLREVLLKLSPR